MGYIRHHAIIVTATYDGWAVRARRKAVELVEKEMAGHCAVNDMVGPILGPTVNGTETFIIGPDGSKEGWETSGNGDAMREQFIAWLEEQKYDDGSSPIRWVEVQYGDDNSETLILADSDAAMREEA